MSFNPDVHHRRSIRLGGYDYSRAGAYFVTICTRNRDCLLGELAGGEMRLNEAGRIVQEEWMKSARLRPRVILDEFVVMPNHLHGIIALGDGRGTLQRAPTTERFGKPTSDSIPTIVRLFKSATTKRINEIRGTPNLPVWQRNYYEHVIRNDEELTRIRKYIQDNPLKWEMDRENPAAQMMRTSESWQV
jgi:REP element-mobilizing transposase RayT